jgi:hypothetical protein
LAELMPPIATRGLSVSRRIARTPSRSSGAAVSVLVGVAKTGLTASSQCPAFAAVRACSMLSTDSPMIASGPSVSRASCTTHPTGPGERRRRSLAAPRQCHR